MKDGLFLEMTGIPHANQRNRPSPCITYDEQIDICVLLTSAQREPGAATWPPCLGLFNFMVATLAYLRQNRTRSDIGDSLGVSQPTISRAVTVITPLLSMILAEYVPVADELGPEVQYIVDGTLLPCWSWDGHQSIATSGQRRKWQWQAKEAKLRCPR